MNIRTVAVVDDNRDAGAVLVHTLQDAGLEGEWISPEAPMVSFVADLISKSDAVICDHRLGYAAQAGYTGAMLANALVEGGHPTILVTQYLDQEADVAIRKFRANLPVVLRRQDASDPDELREALAACLREIRGGPTGSRRSQKTAITIDAVFDHGSEAVVDAVVHGWNAQDAVRFPLSLVQPDLRSSVKPGAIFYVSTNLSAQEKVDLYFDGFEVAREGDPELLWKR
ncbi:MAG: hypothetical protein ACJ8GV_01270 [Luteimonas sp.]